MASTREIAGLDEEQRVLAGQVLSSEAAHVARAGPKADQPALPGLASARGGDVELDAAIKGELRGQPRLGFAAGRVPAGGAAARRAWRRSRWRLPQALATAHAALAALPPPPAKPLNAAFEGSTSARPRPRRLDVAFLEPAPLADARSRVPAARLRKPPAPIRCRARS